MTEEQARQNFIDLHAEIARNNAAIMAEMLKTFMPKAEEPPTEEELAEEARAKRKREFDSFTAIAFGALIQKESKGLSPTQICEEAILWAELMMALRRDRNL